MYVHRHLKQQSACRFTTCKFTKHRPYCMRTWATWACCVVFRNWIFACICNAPGGSCGLTDAEAAKMTARHLEEDQRACQRILAVLMAAARQRCGRNLKFWTLVCIQAPTKMGGKWEKHAPMQQNGKKFNGYSNPGNTYDRVIFEKQSGRWRSHLRLALE
jgi:hypothetical protein